MIRIGMLMPSSNTVAEPTTVAMLRDVPGVSLHIARFRVTRLDQDPAALAQFTAEALMIAAEMLADAKVHSIALNATASCYTGIGHDRDLVAAITRHFAIPASTAMLSLLELLAAQGATRIGLVTPFLHDVQAATVQVLAAEGLTVTAERHLNDPGNYTFADYDEAVVQAMTEAVAATRPQAIALVSTNMRGARPAVAVEAATGLPAIDTVATTLWGALRAAGADPALVRGWGGVFGQAR